MVNLENKTFILSKIGKRIYVYDTDYNLYGEYVSKKIFVEQYKKHGEKLKVNS